MGPLQMRHCSHEFATQSSHSVDLAGWQAKMAIIDILIPRRNARKPHFTNFRCVKISVASACEALGFIFIFGAGGCRHYYLMHFSYLVVFLVSVKPLTIENTKN